MLPLLASAGADLNMAMDNGAAPAHLAAMAGQSEVLGSTLSLSLSLSLSLLSLTRLYCASHPSQPWGGRGEDCDSARRGADTAAAGAALRPGRGGWFAARLSCFELPHYYAAGAVAREVAPAEGRETNRACAARTRCFREFLTEAEGSEGSRHHAVLAAVSARILSRLCHDSGSAGVCISAHVL